MYRPKIDNPTHCARSHDAMMVIIVFGAGDVIAWHDRIFVLVGTMAGGYGPASGLQLLGQALVRRSVIMVAAGMTDCFVLWARVKQFPGFFLPPAQRVLRRWPPQSRPPAKA